MLKDDMSNALIRFLADDRESLLYRPRLRTLTGSVTATILLSQIMWRASKNGWKPFYKFKEPCNHPQYREGDSWEEEIGFSRREFDTALSKIGTKATKGVTVESVLAGHEAKNLVVFWTDSQRVTWYALNTDLLGLLLEQVYESQEIAGAIENENPLVESLKRESAVSSKKLKAQSAVSPDLKRESAVSYRANPPLEVKRESAFTYNKEAETTTETTYRDNNNYNNSRSRRSDPTYDAICSDLENNGFGMMTDIMAKLVNELMDTYPHSWIQAAIPIAVKNGSRNLSYVAGILRNQQSEGMDGGKTHANTSRSNPNNRAPAARKSPNEHYNRLSQ